MVAVKGGTMFPVPLKWVSPNSLSSLCLALRLETDKQMTLLLFQINKQHISDHTLLYFVHLTPWTYWSSKVIGDTNYTILCSSLFGGTSAAQAEKLQRKTWTTEQRSQGQSTEWMTAIKSLHARHNWQRQSPNVCLTLPCSLYSWFQKITPEYVSYPPVLS